MICPACATFYLPPTELLVFPVGVDGGHSNSETTGMQWDKRTEKKSRSKYTSKTIERPNVGGVSIVQ